MNCSYHPQNFAVVQCQNCARPLCPACDHRIKGFPYCQDCIVAGIDSLQNERIAANGAFAARHSSPVLATLLSFVCPGLGAAYNGQNSKALAHFGVFVGLFQMAVISRSSIFVFGYLGMWLFAAVDAWRTARALKSGNALGEDLLTRQLSGNRFVWAISLIVLGTLFVLHTTFNFRLPMRELLPIFLIAVGVYWLVNIVQNRRRGELPDAGATNSFPLMREDDTVYDSLNTAKFQSSKARR